MRTIAFVLTILAAVLLAIGLAVSGLFAWAGALGLLCVFWAFFFLRR